MELIIKKCPFCGREALLVRQPLAYGNLDGWAVQCQNDDCYASSNGLAWPSQDGALTAWNTRVNEHCDKADKRRKEYFKCDTPCNLAKQCKENDKKLLEILRGCFPPAN